MSFVTYTIQVCKYCNVELLSDEYIATHLSGRKHKQAYRKKTKKPSGDEKSDKSDKSEKSEMSDSDSDDELADEAAADSTKDTGQRYVYLFN